MSTMNNYVLKEMTIYLDSEGIPEDILFKCQEIIDSGYVNREYCLSEVIPSNVSVTDILSTTFYIYGLGKDEYTVEFDN